MTEVRVATRSSHLAMVQARLVARMLQAAHRDVEVMLVTVESEGDRDRQSPVAELTEIGAFVRSIQQAVLDNRADLAVHSLKDLPIDRPDGLEIVAVPERAAPYDVMVGAALDDLPAGALVGTGSPRRTSQLLAMRSDLRTTELRGNVDTRLEKVAAGEVAGAVLAAAGLERLGRSDAVKQRFRVTEMVPAPGQGALAVEARTGSEAARLAAAIDDPAHRVGVTAERMLLEATGAGCRSSLGALAEPDGKGMTLHVFVEDGNGPRRASVTGRHPSDVVSRARGRLKL